MRILIQNVLNAEVTISENSVGKIGRGYCLFVGFTNGDDEKVVEKMANKLLHARLFPDINGKTNLSIFDINGQILSISQFTLYGSLKEGRRPSFINALEPVRANELYKYFNYVLEKEGLNVETGSFGKYMEIFLVNEGPFTILLDSKDLK